MKKIFFVIIHFLILFKVFGQSSIYQDFIDINNSFTKDSLLVNQRLEIINTHDGSKKIKIAKSIFCERKEFTVLPEDKNLSILSTTSGYWMKNSKTKKPIKISGSFSVDEIQMQDLLKIDYENDYEITESNLSEFLLKRKNKKISYAHLKLSYDASSKAYTVFVLDNDFKTIKKIVYEASFVDNIQCFSRIKIYNMAFNTNIENCFVTESIKPIKVSKALFVPEHMDELLKCVN